jgi:hypothetical protein
MRWDDLRRQAPRLAAFAHDRLIAPGVLLVVTIRPDGAARLSPVEPFVWEGELWLSMMWQSRKAIDLLRDDRILVHSITTTRDGNEGEARCEAAPFRSTTRPSEPTTATRSPFSAGNPKSRTSISSASRSATSRSFAMHRPVTNASHGGLRAMSSYVGQRHQQVSESTKSQSSISFALRRAEQRCSGRRIVAGLGPVRCPGGRRPASRSRRRRQGRSARGEPGRPHSAPRTHKRRRRWRPRPAGAGT